MSEWDEWKRRHEKPKRFSEALRVVESLSYFPITDEEREMINVLAKCSLSNFHDDFIEQMKGAKNITLRQRNYLAGLYYAYRGQHKQPVIKPEGWR